jgi:hypothetical protein
VLVKKHRANREPFSSSDILPTIGSTSLPEADADCVCAAGQTAPIRATRCGLVFSWLALVSSRNQDKANELISKCTCEPGCLGAGWRGWFHWANASVNL